MALNITCSWPDSVLELLKTVGPRTEPTTHGAAAEDAFDLVLPSMLGYGFSGEPKDTGWGRRQHLEHLGGADKPPWLYPLPRQGGDWGSPVSAPEWATLRTKNRPLLASLAGKVDDELWVGSGKAAFESE